MAPRHFLILLAVISSFSGADAGSSSSSESGFSAMPAGFRPFGPYCSSTGNYTLKSPYMVNLVNLMGDLRSGATASSGFNDSVAGQAPDAVFGLVMCYADCNVTQGKNCLQTATSDVQLICPYSREMKAFDDACMIRYSNESFFSDADLTNPNYTSNSNFFVTDMATMNSTRWNLLSRLAGEAAVSESELRFANGSTRYRDSQGTSQVIYGLAQCTRDLNASECTRCLTTFMEGLSSSSPSNTYGHY